MKIKGVALMTRKRIVAQQFGEEAWDALYTDMAERFPSFKQPLLATTTFPLGDFLGLHDELVRRFYGGQQRAYFALGEQSVRWAVTEGPYKSFVASRDLGGFVRFFPRTWTTYFVDTTSYCEAERVSDDVVDFMAFDLPVWHPYLEYFIVGYFQGALELVCARRFRAKQTSGGSGTQYRYRLTATPDGPSSRTAAA